MFPEYLKATTIIDWQNTAVLKLAGYLSEGKENVEGIALACFEWVRDEIRHSFDYQMNPVTCCASEVLASKTGYCYAKSHLLAALLRANAIPTGFCYQRLSVNDNGPPYCLHGLNALYLPKIGWYRMDPRGNKAGINAQFTPPKEQLAYQIRLPGEADLPQVFAEPLSIVVQALQTAQTYEDLFQNLPDIAIKCLNSKMLFPGDVPSRNTSTCLI